MPKSFGPVIQLFLYNATATQAGTIYQKNCITGPEDLGFCLGGCFGDVHTSDTFGNVFGMTQECMRAFQGKKYHAIK